MAGLIAFATVKGGCGKTSLAVHVAAALHRAGEPVALLDLDPQASATRWARRMGELFPIVSPEPSDDLRGSTIEAIGRALDTAALVIADPPPSSLDVLRVLVAVADLLVVPSGGSVEEIYLAARTLELARQERRLVRRGSADVLLLATRILRGTTTGREAVDALAELGPTADTVIYHRVAWLEAASAGCTVWDLPASRHADAQREASAFLDDLRPLIP